MEQKEETENLEIVKSVDNQDTSPGNVHNIKEEEEVETHQMMTKEL